MTLIEPPWPLNEPSRLQALASYGILDTPREDVFDRVTRLMARHFGTPIALVNLIDETRQWSKSRFGQETDTLPRRLTFCAYTILENRVFVVGDAGRDERFRDNPYIAGAPFLRFYAGAPLLTPDGLTIGTACVLDIRPHDDFDAGMKKDMIDFAALVMQEIEARRAFADAERARTEAEAANAAKTRFLAAASHDLRQPLQAAVLFEGMLPKPTGATGREAARHLHQALESMSGILSALFDVSRLEAGAIRTEIASVPLGPLFDKLVAEFRPQAAAKGLTLTCVPCRSVVRTDPLLFDRILRNLLENAVRYTNRGRILLGCRRRGSALRVEVWDTGSGMAADHLERIWEEFYQVANPERDRAKGLGLGLAIVKRAAELLGHGVYVRSVFGRGSVFGIEVPEAGKRVRAPVPVPVPVPAPARRGQPEGGGRLVVLVEDDAIVLAALQSIFREWGYAVIAAASADEAVDRLRRSCLLPDLIVADYRLREERVGTEAVLRMRALSGRAVPAMLLTGETGPEVHRDAGEHGISVVQKPITPTRLGAVLLGLDAGGVTAPPATPSHTPTDRSAGGA